MGIFGRQWRAWDRLGTLRGWVMFAVIKSLPKMGKKTHSNGVLISVHSRATWGVKPSVTLESQDVAVLKLKGKNITITIKYTE